MCSNGDMTSLTPYRASYYLDTGDVTDRPRLCGVVRDAAQHLLGAAEVRARTVMGLMEIQLEYQSATDADAVRPFITAATALSHVTRVDTVSLQARQDHAWRSIDVLSVVRGEVSA